MPQLLYRVVNQIASNWQDRCSTDGAARSITITSGLSSIYETQRTGRTGACGYSPTNQGQACSKRISLRQWLNGRL